MMFRLTNENQIAFIGDNGIISFFHFRRSVLNLSHRILKQEDQPLFTYGIIDEKTQIPIFIKNLIVETYVGCWRFLSEKEAEPEIKKVWPGHTSSPKVIMVTFQKHRRTYVRSVRVGENGQRQTCTLCWNSIDHPFDQSLPQLYAQDGSGFQTMLHYYRILDSHDIEKYRMMSCSDWEDRAVLLEQLGSLSG